MGQRGAGDVNHVPDAGATGALPEALIHAGGELEGSVEELGRHVPRQGVRDFRAFRGLRGLFKAIFQGISRRNMEIYGEFIYELM